MRDKDEIKLEVIEKMAEKKVIQNHHKQPQSIAGWFDSHERGMVKDCIDELSKSATAPVVKKPGRGTVYLSSMQAAKEYINRHGGDFDDDKGWALKGD